MRSTTIAAIMATFTSTTLASVTQLPSHGFSLFHRGLHARQVWGQCGTDANIQCGPGYCCSQWGYCGVTPDYCGAGCQSQFGTCSQSSSVGSSAKAVVKPDVPVNNAPAAHSQPAAPALVNKGAPPASGSPKSGYTQFLGTGSTGQTAPLSGLSNKAVVHDVVDGSSASEEAWPAMDQWVSFGELWAENLNTMSTSTWQGGLANSPEETDWVEAAINKSASTTGIDNRFILAIMMQESKGCVRVTGTVNSAGLGNPGLFQSAGTASCFGAGPGGCSQSTIDQMVTDGVAGVAPSNNGLLQNYDLAGSSLGLSGAQQYYAAARLYNSGMNSLKAGGDLGAPGATPCYSSDIANRLLGWGSNGGSSPCTLTN